MANIQGFLRSHQLQYRRSHPLTKAVVVTAIALSTVALVTLRMAQWDAQQKLAVLEQQAAALEASNNELAQRIENLGTMESIRQIAAEELGLVDPDTVVIDQSE